MDTDPNSAAMHALRLKLLLISALVLILLALSIGFQRVLLLVSRIKVNVALAGHSVPLVPLKELSSYTMVIFPLFLNNNWLIAPLHTATKDATVA